ncbi:acetyltransferase [Colletotrichum abscissum]|uniref:Acetyltransferase n=1 Tax=Colletotrichum abscissum TaxID=1671311 RepID=A0A9P9XHH2_9PEZI|nr:acetyltransferase [Colletotrichum abscissum]KAI3553919.1 acetyltransferase [Colletotrichum abscissum]KAK1472165.1 acetyltransferase [Colletotrichum abscissum]
MAEINDLISVTFRVATKDDAPQVAQLVEAAFRAEDSRADWTADMELGRSFRYSADEALATIINPDAVVLMGFDFHGVLATSVQVVFKREAQMARIAMLSVNPQLQRSGVGRQTLDSAQAYAWKHYDIKKLGLNALSSREKLLAWYERCGYRRTGETSPFPVDRFPRLDLPKDLCFIELEKDATPVVV